MFNSDLLAACSNARAISGFEGNLRQLIRKELAGIADFQQEPSGNLIASIGSKDPSAPSIMFLAHMDEIGFMVQSISPDGYIGIVPIGGWWNHTLPSQRVTVRSHDGREIRGQIGSKPPHLLPESQRRQVLSDEALYIDIGASNCAEVESLGIGPGCPVTPDSSLQALDLPHRWMGKAFDNRVGVYTMIQLIKGLASEQLNCRVIAAASVQEELGMRGAKALLPENLADIIIVLEGPPADDTLGMPSCGRMGELSKGVQLRLYDPTHLTPPALAAFVREVAEEHDIPCQWAVRRSGGTDAGAAYSNWHARPAIVFGVPVRYIHSHNGILDDRDIEAMLRLSLHLVQRLSEQPSCVHSLLYTDS